MDDRSKAVVAEQVKCRQLEAKVSDLKAQVEQAEKMSAEYKASLLFFCMSSCLSVSCYLSGRPHCLIEANTYTVVCTQ